MEFIELLIIITMTITFSNILSKVMPTIPIFFAQIFLGILLGMTKYGHEINFEPEIFLVMIIAPLLFREGEEADISSIAKNFSTILFLAFGGVILTLFAVGITLHTFFPAIPLAACLAFGAALGPTDAVAVGSLAKKLKMPPKVINILAGEGLLNDASGVTAFQFAVTALLTGAFSVLNASMTLFISSIGGAAVGFVVIWVKNRTLKFIEKAAAKDVISFLLIDLLLPFVVYVIAEVIGVSGIIAAVVAGVLQSREHQRVTLFDAELSNISESIWSTIGFTLNALVFLFLGIELSEVFSPVWMDRTYSNLYLLLIVLLVVAVLFIVRFAYIRIFFWLKEIKSDEKTTLQEICLLTFGGVKGTVSLAAIFILPISVNGAAFEHRALLLFLTACVIFVSLLVGMLVLPLFSEGEYEKPIDLKELELLNIVIERLQHKLAHEQLSETEEIAVEAVIDQYRMRIWELTAEGMTESDQKKVQELQAWMVTIEQQGLDEMYQNKEISRFSYVLYSRLIDRYELVNQKKYMSWISFWLLGVYRVMQAIIHPKRFLARKRQKELVTSSKINPAELKYIFDANTQRIRQRLEVKDGKANKNVLSFLTGRREMLLKRLYHKNVLSMVSIEKNPIYQKELLAGYTLERRTIDSFEREEKITPFSANSYRQKVNLLESFAISKSTH
uniref:cation:proton antiporter n=1 Tax=Candidatus Enterococcus willemsii TaxID=1857215 RepID=UPI00403F8C3B